jgi:hypothetical protein
MPRLLHMSVRYSLLDIQFQNIQKYTALLKIRKKARTYIAMDQSISLRILLN